MENPITWVEITANHWSILIFSQRHIEIARTVHTDEVVRLVEKDLLNCYDVRLRGKVSKFMSPLEYDLKRTAYADCPLTVDMIVTKTLKMDLE